MNNKIIIILGILVIFCATAFFVSSKQKTQNTLNTQINKPSIVTPSPVNSDNSNVPLPKEEDIIRTFFNLINEKRIPEAVNMLTPINTSDDAKKQAWGVQFNSFESILIKRIEIATEPAGPNTYKVTFDVKMKPGTETAQPMPYYGWGNGESVRFISLEKIGNLWKISGIATGP